MKKILTVLLVTGYWSLVTANALELSGAASVNVTSDTAATAKNMAMVDARRQIISDALAPYAAGYELGNLIKNTPNDQLANLISTTNISGEKTSPTTYSAQITMTIDDTAAARWMDENNVENWLAAAGDINSNQSAIVIRLTDGLRDIIEMGANLRTNKVNWTIKKISGTIITVSVPTAQRAQFVAAATDAGIIVIR